jgi:hypothetical protein
LSRDPIGETGGINIHGYVRDNPIIRRDHFGLCGDTPSQCGTPTSLVVVGKIDVGDYGAVFEYQLQDASGNALTGSGYTLEEHAPANITNSNNEFKGMANGVFYDYVGYKHDVGILSGLGHEADFEQTFTIACGGQQYNLTTVLRHEFGYTIYGFFDDTIVIHH